jgi:wobble nucleotide-excising tRNase
MLQSVTLQSAHAFGVANVIELGPLKTATFLFGSNGSGKTTISRAIATPELFPGTRLNWTPSTESFHVAVYNRDYVTETLKQARNLPGVFILGEKSAGAQGEIDAIVGTQPVQGTLPEAREKLAQSGSKYSDLEGKLAEERAKLRDRAWAAKSLIPPELAVMFQGFNSSKEKLLQHLIEIADSHASAEDTYADLVSEAKAVFDEDAAPIMPLNYPHAKSLHSLGGFNLLSTPVVGSRDVDLFPLIEHLHNEDWVQSGVGYLPVSNGQCPFCQQHVHESLF